MAVRTAEMEALQELYDKRENNLVFLYGRRGMQQYELIRQFLDGKKSVFYSACECSDEMQREYFANCIRESCKVEITRDDYASLFNRIKSGDPTKLVLIVDHVECILKKDPEFLENIIKLKQKKLYPGPVMIIFMTDSLVFARQDFAELMGKHAKKVDLVLRLTELQFLDVVRKFPHYSVSQSVEVYGVLGGVPEYLNYWDDRRSVKQNICNVILAEDGVLRNEAHRYLSAELREYSVYQTILSAIASGHEKLNDIFQYTGYSRPKISVYMKNLAGFEVVDKVTSFETGGWDNAKKGVYCIANTFLNFWFRFVFPHQSQLVILKPEEFYDRYIAPEIDSYFNSTFRKVCGEFLELSSAVGQLPIRIEKMGTWVGKKGTIDIIAQDKIRNTIVGMCSWSEDSFTYEMYEQLQKNMKDAKVKSEYCYLFSAKKFEEKLVAASKEDSRIVIVDLNEM
ncbi:hypothetical protein SAMN02910358_00254 [Lachnospiraceae bacterium XBB1006]|nr:hypothetical protein SAMN02910358_00254 [Lachnospiraceae bacterium XBB1006]